METLIFYTYEFAASILPFSAAFIFLSHKQKKGGEKTHLLPGLHLKSVQQFCKSHFMEEKETSGKEDENVERKFQDRIRKII